MKPLIIYHGNCQDGFGAAWACWKHFYDNAEYIPGVYQNDPPDVSGREVYMVDFSYKRAVVEHMLQHAKRVTLIDHHKTAVEDLQDLADLAQYTDMEKSGAMLAWNYFHPDTPPPVLLWHIQDRDLWKFDMPNTRPISAALFSYPYDFNQWDWLMAQNIKLFIDEGTAIERKHHKDIGELVKVVTRDMVIGGHTVPMANLPYTLTSDAGNLLAEGKPFAGCYWDTPAGRVFSLRSQDDGLDVGEIAKHYGGGGHKHASGFRIPFDGLEQFEVQQ